MDLEAFRKYQELYNTLRRKELAGMEDETRCIESFLDKLVSSSSFITLLPVKSLLGVIETGRYRSMAELGIDKEMGGMKEREQATKVLFGSSPSTPADWPKYGMLSSKDKYAQLLQDGDAFFRYGSAVITWKRENLIDRTTMTIGSSLDFGQFMVKCPTFLDKCSVVALQGTNYFGGRTMIPTRRSVAAFAEKISSGSLSLNPSSIADAFDGELGYENYELQIHGTLRLDRDVEEIEYLSMGSDSDDALFSECIGKLEEMGIRAKRFEDFTI